MTRLYQPTNSGYSIKQAIAAMNGLVASAMLTIACLYLTKTSEDYSRIWFVTSILLAFIAIILARIVLGKLFHISTNPRAIILLGANKTADRVQNILKSTDGVEINIVDCFNTHSRNILTEVALHIENHRKNSATTPITEVWVTHDVFSHYGHEELSLAFNNCSVAIVYIPELPEMGITSEEHIQMVKGIPTINSDFSKHQKLGQLLKFIEDQTIAWSALIVLSPVLLIIAISIKRESRGPVIYKQERYGFGGKAFLIWKFRTMYVSESDTEFKQAQKNDPRITKTGKFLRQTSLDELPQLINVINGSMSIVGPRPHPTKLNEQHRTDIKQYMYRHALKPGITGLAQIKGYRGETLDPKLMEQRVKYDLEYIHHWNLFLDIKIVLLTIIHLLTTDKAH